MISLFKIYKNVLLIKDWFLIFFIVILSFSLNLGVSSQSFNIELTVPIQDKCIISKIMFSGISIIWDMNVGPLIPFKDIPVARDFLKYFS